MQSIITQKSQVHIPAKIRKEVGLPLNAAVQVRAERGRVIVEPMKESVLELGGVLKVKNPIPAEEIRKHIQYSEKK